MPKIFTENDRIEIKNRLKANALLLLQSKPYRKIAVEEITAKTGIAKGTFYNFFSSKEDFFYEILSSISEENIKKIKAITSSSVTKKQELRNLLCEMIFEMESLHDNLSDDDMTIIARLKDDDAFFDEAKVFTKALYEGKLKIRKEAEKTTCENMFSIILDQRRKNRIKPIRNYEELIKVSVKALVNYLYE